MQQRLDFHKREGIVCEHFRLKWFTQIPDHILQCTPKLLVNVLSDEIKAGMAEGNRIPFSQTPDFSVIKHGGIRISSEYMTIIDITEQTSYSFWKILNAPCFYQAERLKCMAFRRWNRIQRKQRKYIPRSHSGWNYWIASSELMIKN